jgi:benzoylformate decarboxylase
VKQTGAEAFVELLRDEDVDYVFGNPGSTELVLMDALAAANGPSFILGLHEAIVMSMAHGYAASTGRLAAVNLHAAPGLGNALGMLYNVKKAHAPVLVTAGQQDLSIAAREPLLWDDLATIARPFVKWSVEITRLADLPRIVRRAVKTALAPPAGPVFLSLPGDVLAETAELDLLGRTRVAPALRGDWEAIQVAADLICASTQPMIFAGDSVCSSRAHGSLVAFAEMIGAPVYFEAMADRAAFPTSHALFAGAIPRLGSAVRAVVDRHDLIISVGGDLFTESLATGVDPIPSEKAIVHIDDDPWQLGKNYATVAAILGSPAAVLPELVEVVRKRADRRFAVRVAQRFKEVVDANAARRQRLKDIIAEGAGREPMRPIELLQAIGDILPPNVIVVDESLSSGGNLCDLVRLDDENAYLGLRGGGIGAGLPQAIGAKLGNPERPVVAYIGDGSAMFSMQSLWTAAHYKIAVAFVIVNNGSYRILKQRTRALGGHGARTGEFLAMDLDRPAIDFPALAGALGVSAIRTTSIEGVRAALVNALSADEPRLIELIVDPSL